MNPSVVQDLRSFRLPPGFRGRPAWLVQLWWLVQATLFRLSPRFCYGWRRWLLRAFGAKVGKGVLVRSSAEVTFPWRVSLGDWSWIGDDVVLYSLAQINVGAHCVVSQRSYVCTGSHDWSRPSFDMRAAPVTIEDQAWVAADVFIAPGVTIGRGAVVRARSTVLASLPPQSVCAGDPARPVRPRLRGPDAMARPTRPGHRRRARATR